MRLASKILKVLGWHAIEADVPDKCIIVLAPHTSNWDFFYGLLYRSTLGIQAKFLIKDDWFRFPFGRFMKRVGGVAVNRDTHTNLTEELASLFEENESYHIAITPEGTRKANKDWKMGFYHIASKAQVPVALAYIDYKNKAVGISQIFHLTGDKDGDLRQIKSAYSAEQARYPEKFKI